MCYTLSLSSLSRRANKCLYIRRRSKSRAIMAVMKIYNPIINRIKKKLCVGCSLIALSTFSDQVLSLASEVVMALLKSVVRLIGAVVQSVLVIVVQSLKLEYTKVKYV